MEEHCLPWCSEAVGDVYDETGSPAGINVNGGAYFFVKNLQGDVTAIVSYNGTVICKYYYDAYGYPIYVKDANGANITSANHIALLNPFRYRGYMYDEETCFYYLRTRYYDPYIGRFLNADGYVSTGTGLGGYNMFAYCNGNPVMFVDPSGTISTYASVMNDYFTVRNGIASNNPDYAWANAKYLNRKLREAATYEIVSYSQMVEAGFDNMSVQQMYDLNTSLIDNGITTAVLVSHFLAQCAVESNFGKWLTELGNESYWSTNGYGAKFRGAGYIHITWDYNYLAFANSVGDMEIYNQGAEYVAANYAWQASAWWWSNNKMNAKINGGYTVDDVSRTVLGGYNSSFDTRKQYFYTFLDIFGG